LQQGIDRDTTISQQGKSGRLEKNGAVLLTEKGRTSYLQSDPSSGTYTAYNPLPDLTDWSMELPDGSIIRADGKVGLLRVIVQPSEKRVWIDSATKPDQIGPKIATSLLVFGFKTSPLVVLNGKPLPGPFRETLIGTKPAYVVPLGVTQKN
jgi:hypothetical protein